MSLITSVDLFLTGCPLSPPFSSLCFEAKLRGLSIVVLQHMRPSIWVSIDTDAISLVIGYGSTQGIKFSLALACLLDLYEIEHTQPSHLFCSSVKSGEIFNNNGMYCPPLVFTHSVRANYNKERVFSVLMLMVVASRV